MPKKILSLDGGGSWAILQAMALKEIYKDKSTKCRDILNEFDVISANSGGSLVLAGMIEYADEDIEKVIETFKNENLRTQIFSKLKSGERNFLEWVARFVKVGPKYKAERKIDGLKKSLPKTGTLKMCDLKKETGIKPDLVICGFDYDFSRATFFKTDQGNEKYIYTLADAVNASSNAPVNYFDAPVSFNYDDDKRHQYWDGAVGGNNNPVLIGITEILRIYEGPRTCEDILVLSIGTGNNLLPVKGFSISDNAQNDALMKSIDKASLSKDIEKLGVSILSEPPEAANFMAHMFLGGVDTTTTNPNPKACIIRMNALLQPELKEKEWIFPGKISMKDYNDFIFLIKLGMDAVAQEEVLKIEKLGKWWLEDKVVNQSIRYNGKTLECLIGHDRFSKAKTEWLGRCGIL
jgi:hypothetical protein